MKARRADLIVPIRDRRQHKRYVTLRNFRNVSLVLLAAFLVVTIRGEMRGLRPGGYGRLLGRELPEAPAARPVQVVREAAAPVPEVASADPTLLEPMTRAQWLEAGVNGDVDNAQAEPAATAASISAPTMQARVEGDSHIAIVGGAGGITVVKEPRKKPVLSGGFGR